MTNANTETHDDGELQAAWATEMTERDERPTTSSNDRPLSADTLNAFFGRKS